MHRKLCLLHANCQGEELAALLQASAAFSKKYRLVRRINYTREPVSARELAECSLFLYQQLGESWNELASRELLRQLSPSALALQIPNLFFKGYWPFWTSQGPIAFGDSLLNRLIDEGAPKPVILKLYLHGDPGKFVNLKASLEESIALEREKEARSCVKYVDFLLRRWKERMIFLTVNHPGREMLLHVAGGILETLGLPTLSESERALSARHGHFPSYADFELPIHPKVATFHGLRFCGMEQDYAVFTRRLRFEEYSSRYIDCRLNGMEAEFLGYLQLV